MKTGQYRVANLEEIVLGLLSDGSLSRISNTEIAKSLCNSNQDIKKAYNVGWLAQVIGNIKKKHNTDSSITANVSVSDIKKVIVDQEKQNPTVKLMDVDLEIDKAKWLKTEYDNRQLKQKLNDKEKIHKVLTEELDHKVDYIESLLSQIPKLPIIKDIPKIKIDNKKTTEEAVMMISDIHAGEVVNFNEMDGFGEYDFEIMCNRFYFLCEKTIEVIENQRNITNINKLWVDCLGDFVHGELHQPETNETAMVSVVLNLASVLSQGIAMLSRHFNEIEVTGLVGNHGRLDKMPPSKRIYNNWDYMVYQITSVMLKDYKNIKFNIPKSSSCIVNRMNHKFLLMHGDSIKGGFAGIPVYGMARAFSKQQEIRRNKGGFDYMELGHFHQDLKINDGKLIVNGSMVGNNEFALNKLHTVADSMQKIFCVNDKYGISWERSMKLSSAKDNKFVYSFDDNVVYGNILKGVK